MLKLKQEVTLKSQRKFNASGNSISRLRSHEGLGKLKAKEHVNILEDERIKDLMKKSIVSLAGKEENSREG